MQLGKVTFWISVIALMIILVSFSTFAPNVRAYVYGTHLKPVEFDNVSESEYRACLRREAGVVGVVSLKQMRKCTEDTGYGK